MERKPQDLLEFLRRNAAGEGADASATAPRADAPPRAQATDLVLRRSQIFVAAVAGGLLVVLAFVLGLVVARPAPHAATGAAAESATPVWTIRLITYQATEQGEINAKITMNNLETLFPGQVSLQRIPGRDEIVVTVGAWLRDPKQDPKAIELLDQIRNQQDVAGKKHFPKSYFWTLPR